MTITNRTLGEVLGFSLFNARDQPPERVAELFVQNANLEKLVSKDNTILVGPRGSGKTTLMKMLTRVALDRWDTPLARALLERAILPVYIGSDIVTRSQLLVPQQILTAERDLASFAIVRRAKLSLHFLLTVLEAIDHETRSKRAEVLDFDTEAHAVERLSLAYRIQPAFPSILALADAASNLLLDLSSAIQASAVKETQQLRRLARTAAMPALSDVITVTQEILVAAFNGLPSKWILLFDEIEYLPDDSRQEILQLVRTLGPSFGIKIAFTPVTPTAGYFAEVESSFLHAGHDYLPITMAPNGSGDILKFSEDLYSTMIQRVYGEDAPDLPRAFGVSAFADQRTSADLPATFHTVGRPADDDLVRLLAENQPRFAKYAGRMGFLEPGGVAALSAVERSSRFRKAVPIMLLWRERLKKPIAQEAPGQEKHEKRQFDKRTRKSHQIYTGFPTVILLADGNPRVMMQMLTLLPWTTGRPLDSQQLARPLFSVADQDESIEGARVYQLSLANAYLSHHGRVLNDLFAMDLLHHVGLIFEENTHFGQSFNPDPATSFLVDVEPDPNLGAALIDAVYTGALVELDSIEGDRAVLHPGEGLTGRRFRLSYLLGTHYWLPVRKGRQVVFSSLLKVLETSEKPHGSAALSRQATMF